MPCCSKTRPSTTSCGCCARSWPCCKGAVQPKLKPRPKPRQQPNSPGAPTPAKGLAPGATTRSSPRPSQPRSRDGGRRPPAASGGAPGVPARRSPPGRRRGSPPSWCGNGPRRSAAIPAGGSCGSVRALRVIRPPVAAWNWASRPSSTTSAAVPTIPPWSWKRPLIAAHPALALNCAGPWPAPPAGRRRRCGRPLPCMAPGPPIVSVPIPRRWWRSCWQRSRGWRRRCGRRLR